VLSEKLEAAVASDIGAEDGGEFAFKTLLRHGFLLQGLKFKNPDTTDFRAAQKPVLHGRNIQFRGNHSKNNIGNN
jgi:hypothetical protein